MSGVELLDRMRPTWVEIDLDVWRENLISARGRLPESCGLVPVLKADGYGHGARQLARIAAEEGSPLIAVALLEEALEILPVVGKTPLLVLGPLSRSATREAIRRGIGIGVTGIERLALAVECAGELGKEAVIHLKLDSGMGRMGLTESDLEAVVSLVSSAQGVRVESIYTHFATADEREHEAFGLQQERFARMLSMLRERGVTAPRLHSANSAAIWRGDQREPGDLARAGLLLLGAEVIAGEESRLRPVLRWRTELARVKELAPGEGVGYGHTWRATRASRVGTLPVGYADGYSRALSSRGVVLVRGRRAPVIGRVSMDLVTIDLTELPEVRVGDEVVLLGRQGREEVPVEEIAGLTGTIAYEVFCAISSRVPRVWKRRGHEWEVGSRFLETLSEDRS